MLVLNFKDLVNGIETLPEEILNYKSVLYRIHESSTDKNYIGTAKYGLPSRLYDRCYGHVTLYKRNETFKCRGMYHRMNENIDDFSIYIEHITDPDNYDTILEEETNLIKTYDSVLRGYNVSPDGKPGWKNGSICVNDGEYDLYIFEDDLDRFLNNGYTLGSCKHDFLKGTIWVNNGIESKMIKPDQVDFYLNNGYSRGSNYSPNKGKIWVNNGVVSKLVNKDLYCTDGFVNLGRIENTPRSKRGKYSKPKKVIVSSESSERAIPLTDLEEFLKNNPEYIKGRRRKVK